MPQGVIEVHAPSIRHPGNAFKHDAYQPFKWDGEKWVVAGDRVEGTDAAVMTLKGNPGLYGMVGFDGEQRVQAMEIPFVVPANFRTRYFLAMED